MDDKAKENVRNEVRMVKIEAALKHIQRDLDEIKSCFKRIDDLERTKYRMQGIGYVLASGIFILLVEVFILK